jgi:hypothetical protein
MKPARTLGYGPDESIGKALPDLILSSTNRRER